ncbi:MAG: RNase adapter RapZ [Ruminococcaceae bacterium]|nr:RNase adapter RapZ [Oscillospiraceae bacterium]
MRFLIITGLSGAGKTVVANELEDIGFFCIDNMPSNLIPTFAEMALQLKQFENIAVVTDVRTKELYSGLGECLFQLEEMNIEFELLFLNASDETLSRRYVETRRAHPLALESDSPIKDAIAYERTLTNPIRELADHYIDTTNMTVPDLRRMVCSLFLKEKCATLKVTCISFGFKYGIPTESNIVLDVRFLPNPFYIETLSKKSGLDQEVKDYVLSFDETSEVFDKFSGLIKYLLPLYQGEGRSQLVVSIGCTGGKHRSVVLVEILTNLIKELGYDAIAIHRDIAKIL